METEVRMGITQRHIHEGNNGKPAKPAIELDMPIDRLPFVDFEYDGARFVSKGAQGVGNLDFQRISNLIAKEPDMSPRSESELETSWDSGLAVAVIKGEKIVGYSRLVEKGSLTAKDETERKILGSEKTRKVYEIASVIVDPGARELHLGRTMLKAVMSLRLDEVKKDEAVFISTTNVHEDSRFHTSLNSAALEFGIRFVPLVHTDLKEGVEVACKGCPANNKGSCLNRVTGGNLLRLVLGNLPEGRENCVLYISRADGAPHVTVLFDSRVPTNGDNHASI